MELRRVIAKGFSAIRLSKILSSHRKNTWFNGFTSFSSCFKNVDVGENFLHVGEKITPWSPDRRILNRDCRDRPQREGSGGNVRKGGNSDEQI
jgi:hypothetical protein